jgi:hypothetical protein
MVRKPNPVPVATAEPQPLLPDTFALNTRERKRVEKLRYMHRNPVKDGTGPSARTMAMEQLPQLRLQRVKLVRINQWPTAELMSRPAA